MARRKNLVGIVDRIRQIGTGRIVAALGFATVGGALSFALAASGVTRYKNPQVAMMMMPSESEALAARADQLLFASNSALNPRIGALAKKALEQQSLNPAALRLLGYVEDVKGNRQRARALVKLAQRLSRREPGTQLWLIEDYARVNDTVNTLVHYDILLTTKPETQPLLYPRLSNAISDGGIRTELLPYLRKNKSWATGFVSYAIANDKDPSNIVSLVTEAQGLPKTKVTLAQHLSLMNKLVSEKRFMDAKRIYHLIPGANAARLTNPSFDASDRNVQFGAMGWQILDDPDAAGGFAAQKSQKTPAMSVFSNAATTRIVASRLLFLTPSSYYFSAKLQHISRGEGGYLLFQIRCPSSGSDAQVWMHNAVANNLTAPITIPSNCPVQFLDIVASGGKGQSGMEATIASIALNP